MLVKTTSILVTIDPALNEYRDKITFPEKLEKANKVLQNGQDPAK